MFCIPFTTTQDDIHEADESFSVHLASSDAQVQIEPFIYSLGVIVDDDKGILI